MRLCEGPSGPGDDGGVLRDRAGGGRVDDPDGPPWSLTRLRGWIEYPTDPVEVWLAVDETTGAHLGWCASGRPSGRTATGSTSPSTWCRRRAAADRDRAARHAAERRPRTAGRCSPAGRSRARPERRSPTAWARRAGLVEARRVLALDRIPAGRSRSCASRPPARRPGTRWCAGTAAPPTSTWPGAPRWRTRWRTRRTTRARSPRLGRRPLPGAVDDLREKRGRHVYTLAALHDASGEMAAVTAVEADRDNPAVGAPAAHRGHPQAPRAPARAAGQGGDAGLAGDGRAAARAHRDRERRRQPAHDRDQRAARLPAPRAGRQSWR